MPVPDLKPETKGALAVAAGASLWGLFWIPLRYLSDAGFGALWASAMVMGASIPVAIMIALWLGKWRTADAKWVLAVGAGIGISEVFYFYAIVSTDVIRAVFLFYMLPIWATLIDRVVFGVRLSIGRSFAVMLAFFGLWLLLGGDGGLALPRNAGDWSGLAAGFFWDSTLALVSGRAQVDPYWNVTSAIVCGAIFSVIAAVLFSVEPLSGGTFTFALVIGLLAFGTFVLWPSMIGQLWGARLVPATRAALLTMSEILVATTSAWFLIGSSLTVTSALGGLVIVVAVLVDIYSTSSANSSEAQ